MTQRTPIPKRRKTPRTVHWERTGSHPRVRLRGAAKTERRREIFERSGGRCEALIKWEIGSWRGLKRCLLPITWDTMHWSHKGHGARKCDCLDCGIASCAECHLIGVHNPKSVPRKPERIAV